MDVRYRSTRSDGEPITSAAAILRGIAPDGGLYVPTAFPDYSDGIAGMVPLSYQDLAFRVMRGYLPDFTDEELWKCVRGAYDEKFDDPAIAPLAGKGDAHFLELFHGNTIAFKDMALSILPYLMTTAAAKEGSRDEIVILTATSGDTGKAAMAGFADVPGTRIIVFYPDGGVSRVQELQMVTQTGDNTAAYAIRGNFDDAQTAVKKVFTDSGIREILAENGFRFSSANSINIGRLVPQVVYYFYAYMQMVRQGAVRCGEAVNFCVPTGNFGNILAAYYAKRSGLPVGKLICASNRNKVLSDFFESGTYDKERPFYLTSSPSMDILVSSNLERLLFHASGEDPQETAALMAALSGSGKYAVPEEMRRRMADFYGGFAEEEENFAGIAQLYRDTGYVIDTHTGIAYAVWKTYREKTGDTVPTVIASTASPFKFAGSVVRAIDPSFSAADEFAYIDRLGELSGVPEPEAIRTIRTAPVRHTGKTSPETLANTVLCNLGIMV